MQNFNLICLSEGNFVIPSDSVQTTNFSYIKQYSNQSGLTEYNSGVRLPLPT
jgi:hypothetical protein